MAASASTETTPVSPLGVVVLNCMYGEGEWEELIDYGRLRYHLVLEVNPFERECPENQLLKKLGEAAAEDKDDEIEFWADECRTLLWPLIRSDYASRQDVDGAVIRIQGRTINGTLQPLSHNHHLKYPLTGPIANTFPGVRTYPARDIIRLAELDSNIFKIKLGTNIYCMKTIHRTGNEDNFIREVSILQHCSHPYIIPLVGLVIDEEERVEAMLLEYIENAQSVREREQFTQKQCEKWSGQ